MAEKRRWERRRITCREARRETNLLIEWRDRDGREVLSGMSCDNPLLQGLDNRDCKWSCWEEISGEKG